MLNIRKLSCLLSLLVVGICCAQSFDKKISTATLQLPTAQLSGYATKMDFGADELKLGWWKYAKRFALPQNQRTHYEVTIPATNDSKQVVIFTQIGEEESKPFTFKLALRTEGMSEEEKKKYGEQAKAMLLDFKRWFYLRHYEEKLEELEKKLNRADFNWDNWMKFIEERQAILALMKNI